MKIICVQNGWRNEYRIDPRSYEHYWTSNWNKAWKKIQAWYRKGHEFKTRTGLIFFQVLFQLLVQ